MGKYRFQSQAVKEVPGSAFLVPGSASEFSKTSTQNTEVSKRPRISMVGMHLTKTRGGIATLASGILNSELGRDFDFIYLASQAEDYKKVRKALLALSAAMRFIFVCVVRHPTLVYVHLGSNSSLYRESIFIILAKLCGKKVLTHFHAGDIDNYYPNQSQLGKWFIRRGIGLSDRVIAVSHESARQLRGLVPSLDISVLPNAIDTSIFLNIRRTLKEQNDRTVRLLFAGAVGKLKGEIDLIKSLAILRSQKLNVKVSFLGYGAENLAEHCREHGISGLIEHLGPVSMDKRIAFFEQADIFVLPTYAEAMPISLIEAMAAGLAIVSTPVGGIPEIIDDGKEGFLVECGNINTLAEKISLLVNNKDVRYEMGMKARQKACEQMDFSMYVERLRMELISVGGLDCKI